MDFILTQMPNSFLGRLEGVVFFLMFAFAVFVLHRAHSREERIVVKESEKKSKKK